MPDDLMLPAMVMDELACTPNVDAASTAQPPIEGDIRKLGGVVTNIVDLLAICRAGIRSPILSHCTTRSKEQL